MSEATIDDPRTIRKRGLSNAAFGIGGILLSRGLVELQRAFDIGSPMIAGVAVLLFPVIGAFGLTTLVLGSEKGWLRIPLVVVLSLVLIAVAFWVIIPRGYRLES